jgi:hypothetical protein
MELTKARKRGDVIHLKGSRERSIRSRGYEALFNGLCLG